MIILYILGGTIAVYLVYLLIAYLIFIPRQIWLEREKNLRDVEKQN